MPNGEEWRKYKIVTRVGLHYDVLYAGEMSALAMSIRSVGYFMSPVIYVAHDEISHILAIPPGQQEGDGTVTPFRVVP